MKSDVVNITKKIQQKSAATRAIYLDQIAQAKSTKVARSNLSCGNQAHSFAACSSADKNVMLGFNKVNIGIVTAYNDMLSAHNPYAAYPEIIKQACREIGNVAQVAAGVPAMCDGVTQGQVGMELSLLSRDAIAMATAVGLSHNVFDGFLLLGICDKIVPGMLIGALSFGHLPCLFVPAGPMSTGLPNVQKSKIRQQHVQGKATTEQLLQAEMKSYHQAGTCTFYGTANTNQLIMEVMGLQLPSSSFFHPHSLERGLLTSYAAQQVCRLTANSGQYIPISEIVTEKTIVNAIVALLASGGSTNLTLHLVAIARAAGIIIDWSDFAALSKVVPLVAKVYPNSQYDINDFNQAGGVRFLISTLLDAGLLHEDVATVAGYGLSKYTKELTVNDNKLQWRDAECVSNNKEILASAAEPFMSTGGLAVLDGNLGRCVLKTSAVAATQLIVKARAVVIDCQDELKELYEQGALNQDCIIVVRGQGAQANGMPELHKLMPILGSLQDQGYKVALITDGRMSGASGKVPAAIHLYPEAVCGGLIGKVATGDMIDLDAVAGTLELLVAEDELALRPAFTSKYLRGNQVGCGRELFVNLRQNFTNPEQGARSFKTIDEAYGE